MRLLGLSAYRFGAPPAPAGGVLSRPDTYPARGYGRLISQSGESENRGVRVQHTRRATFAARRSPSVRATPPAEAGWQLGTNMGTGIAGDVC